MNADLPLLLDPQQLAAALGRDDLLIVDLSAEENYAAQHIEGALSLAYSDIIVARPPAMGLLPEPLQFHASLQRLGITEETHVVVCDDEGGGRGARFIWSLHAYGHLRCSQLDGGIAAWQAAGLPLTDEATPAPQPSSYSPERVGDNVCDAAYVMSHLGNSDFALLDARSPEEFSGEKALAARGGHIPGAVNYEWTDCMDHINQRRLLPAAMLRDELTARGLTPDKEIVVYCQTHHRSALSYVMLKSLGYPRVRGYHGAWSEWGNRQDTPVER
jgi:thiosulfate/3-mercaptopyruvate sulfurtransferase